MMISIQRTSLVLALLFLAAFAAACGAASAPPVDLPAPITGRIDVSEPSAEGDVTITGSEGAVTGGYIVLAVDEDIASPISAQLLSLLVPSAFAQDAGQPFPEVCNLTGHACALAAADGSFTLVIAASEGDTIALVLIDPITGAFLSPATRVQVPSSGTPSPSANCSGQGVDGAVVDVALSPSTFESILLKQGSGATTNQLVIGSTVVPIKGCFAHSVAVMSTSTGDRIVVTSTNDKILWTGRYAGGAVQNALSFTLDDEPMHVVFVDSATQPVIAMRTATSVVLSRITIGSGEVLATVVPTDGVGVVTGLTRSLAISIKEMDPIFYPNFIGVLLADKGGGGTEYLTFFHAAKMEHKATWSRAYINSANTALNSQSDSFVDVVVYAWGMNAGDMCFGVLDSAGAQNTLRRYHIMLGAAPLQYILDLSTANIDPPRYQAFFPGGVSPLQTIQRSDELPTLVRAIVTGADGNLYWNKLNGDDALVEIGWLTGDTIAATALNTKERIFLGADATTGTAIDGGALLPW